MSNLSVIQKINLISSATDLSGLLEPQKQHVLDLILGIESNGFASDFSGTGTGKTFMSCAVARHFGLKTFVIVPKAVIPSWNRVINKMGVKDITVLNYEKIARGNSIYAKKVMAIDVRTKTRVEKELLQLQFPQDSFLIFDESHKCKGMNSASSQLLLAAYQQKYRFLTVSATQALNALDMFVYGYILGEHNFKDDQGNFYEWCKQFGGKWTESREGFACDGTTDKSKARMKVLHDKLFNLGIARRLTSADFGNSFAHNRIMPEVFDMGSNGSKIDRIFNEMEREIAELYARGYSDHIFAVITKARRQAEILKAPTIVEQILDHHAEGKSIAVFVNFRSTVAAIVERVEAELGKDVCAIVQGGQKDKVRQQNIDDFQDNKKKIIICNMAAGGVGISLHDIHGGHPRVSIISPSYSGIQFIQALGRINRAEGKTECLQYIVFCAGTIEESIAAKINQKLGNLDALNDGDMMGKDYGLTVDVSEKLSDDYFDELVESELDMLVSA